MNATPYRQAPLLAPQVVERRSTADYIKPAAGPFEAEWSAMRNTLILAEHKALRRRFSGAPITALGELA